MYRAAVFSGCRITAILSFEPVGREYISVPLQLSLVSDQEIIERYEVFEGSLREKNPIKTNPTRVVVISNWGVNCGIATYTQYLVSALREKVEVLVLAEVADLPEETGVIRCWDRKGDYFRIVDEVAKYNPDLIIIQHEFGLFHKVHLWQSILSQLARWRVIVTFHTVLEHRVSNSDASSDYRARCFAEMACPEIVVHQKKGRETLRDRGYSGRVHYIPHGCFSPNRDKKLRPEKYGMYPDHTIFQYGFGGRHKGWEFAINTTELLKEKYPDVLYLGVFNLPVGGETQAESYYGELIELVRKKNLAQNVSIIKGFQSDGMLRNLISGVKVGFFPYQSPPNWFSWGASGAVQLPISMGLPLVLGDFSQFEEYRGLFPLVKTHSEAAQEIDKLFSSQTFWKEMSNKAYSLSEQRTWGKVAQWYLSCPADKDFDAL